MTLSTASALVVALVALAAPTNAFLPRSNDGGPVHLSLRTPRSFIPNAENGAQQQAMRRDSFLAATGQHHKRQDASSFSTKTPPQDFRLFVDTMVEFTWVYDSSCTADKCMGNVGGFDTSKSSTYTANATFNNQPGGPPGVEAAGNWCNGTWGRDIVGITNGLSGADRKNESLPNFYFMQCKVGGLDANYTGRAPGILGMLSPNLNKTTLFAKLATGWKDQRFAMQFSKQVAPNGLLKSEDPSGGTLTLGGVNTNLFTGDINYLPLSDKWLKIRNGTHLFWDFAIDVVEYGGKQYRSTNGNGTTGVVHTVATQSLVPRELWNDIYTKLPGVQLINNSGPQEYYAFPCNSSSQLSPLDFTMGGKNYSIHPAPCIPHTKRFCRQPRLTDGAWVSFHPRWKRRYHCGCNTDITSTRDSWDYTFGLPFLRELYTVFQFSPPAVGFAQLSASAAANHTATGTGSTPSPTNPSGSSSMLVNFGVVALGLAVATMI
ncbi:Gastricsin [Vanrija pseudolonga]|uniref:Gastricsin n=1 Tax=Vanrija pseudolonga TaxID=143232 RepID=A0AAF0YGN8_9TREE|nr:Gastricsin [Vanrija pseudolonga]